MKLTVGTITAGTLIAGPIRFDDLSGRCSHGVLMVRIDFGRRWDCDECALASQGIYTARHPRAQQAPNARNAPSMAKTCPHIAARL